MSVAVKTRTKSNTGTATLSNLAVAAKKSIEGARKSTLKTMDYIIDAGKTFQKSHAQLDRGKWEKWCRYDVGISPQMANRYRTIASGLKDALKKMSTKSRKEFLDNVTVNSAYNLCANRKPSGPTAKPSPMDKVFELMQDADKITPDEGTDETLLDQILDEILRVYAKRVAKRRDILEARHRDQEDETETEVSVAADAGATGAEETT